MPRPLFTVLRGRKQSLDQTRIRVRRIVFNKRADLGCGWEQAGQVHGSAAYERSSIGHRTWLKSLRLLLLQNEAINGLLAPRILLELGRLNDCDSLQGPKWGFLRFHRRGHTVAWIGCSHFDPRFQVRDLAIAELFFWRHLQFGVSITHCLDQSTCIGLS